MDLKTKHSKTLQQLNLDEVLDRKSLQNLQDVRFIEQFHPRY